jgi:peroxiredoxin
MVVGPMSNLLDVDWASIPAPIDDGEARHLVGLKLPSFKLAATNGMYVDLSSLTGRSIVYAYPMTGKPGTPLPDGWDMLPGARGCTPQSCAFRDLASELKKSGASHIFGISTQETNYQSEAATRLHLPFPLLSDHDFVLANSLSLPTMAVAGSRLLKRLTMIIRDGAIEHVFYPVFPPDRNASDVKSWLTAHSTT